MHDVTELPMSSSLPTRPKGTDGLKRACDAHLSVRHDSVDVRIRDGRVFAAENLVGTEPQRVQQLLLPQLAPPQRQKDTVDRGITNEDIFETEDNFS